MFLYFHNSHNTKKKKPKISEKMYKENSPKSMFEYWI